MFFKLLVLICLCSVANIECKKYRYDYKYYSQIEGWLKQNSIPATWHEARLRCHLEGAELVSPLHDEFIKILKTRSHVTTWTGVHSIFSKGDYFSIGGVPILRMPISWAPGEPDNYGDKEQCIAMMPNGTFADVCCDEIFPYFCYKKFTSDVVNTCGTVDPGYIYEYRTRSCYKFHNNVQTWNRAYMTCASEGAHLAIMNTVIENQVLNDLFEKYPVDSIIGFYNSNNDAFIGVHDWGEPGMWTTIHGQSLQQIMDTGVIVWASGNPTNFTSNGLRESCGSIGRHGGLHNVWCYDLLPFICEKLPHSLEEKDDYDDQ